MEVEKNIVCDLTHIVRKWTCPIEIPVEDPLVPESLDINSLYILLVKVTEMSGWLCANMRAQSKRKGLTIKIAPRHANG
jgi:hypothetical protein